MVTSEIMFGRTTKADNVPPIYMYLNDKNKFQNESNYTEKKK